MSPAKKATAAKTTAKKSAVRNAVGTTSSARTSSAKKSPVKRTAVKKSSAEKGASSAFSAEERAAMREAAAERKAAAKGADAEAQVVAKIAEMDASDRAIAEGLHALVRRIAPTVAPRTWYGMPAYEKDGRIVFFLQVSGKFKARYSTLGFQDPAVLDDGAMWPTSFALTTWNATVEREVSRLIAKALG